MIPALIILGIAIGIVPAVSMTKLPSLSSASSGKATFGGKHSLSRRLFVGLQFLMTLVLLVSALVIHKQYKYLQNFDLGFDSEQLVHIPVNDRKLQSRLSILKEEIKLIPGIKGAAITGEDLPSRLNNTWSMEWIGDDREIKSSIDVVGIDQDYFDLIGIAFTAMTTASYVYFRRWECRIQEKESEHRMMILKLKQQRQSYLCYHQLLTHDHKYLCVNIFFLEYY